MPAQNMLSDRKNLSDEEHWPMIQGHPDPTGNGLCHALADCELLVEPTKSEGIFELYRRNAEAAEPRDKPQPTQTTWAIGSMEWLAEQKKSR